MSTITIVGGGPVGAALALALAQQGVPATVLEARQEPPDADPRAIALADGSRLILQRLGVWEALQPQATPIRTIHVSERGRLGRTILRAAELQREALGYVVNYSDLAGSINAAMENAGVEIRRGAAVSDVAPGKTVSTVHYQQDGQVHEIQVNLAVLADGGRSLEGISHLQRKTREYGQCALVARVRSELAHEGVAYERFTPKGPVALLPWGASRDFALVWTATPERAAELCALGEAEFLSQLHGHFGDRAGRFEAVSGRNMFPLKMAWVRPVATDRVVFIGNAAQTLHPVAGQGFNLGLRDAWELSRLILNAPEDAGNPAILEAYRTSRRMDTGGGMLFTDLLVRAFSNDVPGLGAIRGTGLGVLELLGPARNFLMRKMSFGARG